MPLPFDVQSKVRCRNQIWEVGKITEHPDGSWTVRLYPENEGQPKSFIYPHTPIEPLDSAFDHLAEGRIAHIDHYRLLTSATRLSLVYEYDKLLSISNSKMVPEPYQLLAVKKVMEALRQRFLIADDVGLGKTIEAGLIMQELVARQRGSRILIVVPASLQDQWKKEMLRHFYRRFYIYNSRKMEGIRELVDEHLNPWLAKNSIITSIDWIKPQYQGSGAARRNINKVFDQLMNVEKRWDLVMIDEAHYVSTNANRADFAKAVQERCDSLLLLTATPHSGNPEYFFNLLNLLDPFMFAHPDDLDRPDAKERVDKIMIRRGKNTIYELNDGGELVKKFRDRAPHPVEIEFSPEERGLYDAVSAYTAEGWAHLERARKMSVSERNVGKFLLTLVQKRMVSSLAALRETLARRIESIVEHRTVARIENFSVKDIRRLLRDYQSNQFMEDDEKEAVERYLESRDVQAMYAERTTEMKTLRDLLATAENLIRAGQDSKLRWLLEFLKHLFAGSAGEKVIIFTEYRDTLNYLRAQLAERWFLSQDQIVLIHGGMPLGEDEEQEGSKLYAEKRFNDPDTHILLATDAASEGLNLQKYCHILINYELPWNPNRLEQRIGRIHRYGQRHTAQIYNLMIQGSKEAEIFKLLQTKIDIIRKQLGSMADVLGVLDRISFDDLMLRALDKSVGPGEVSAIAEDALQYMEQMAQQLRDTQFLSGCRQFTREDIAEAEAAIADSQQAIPTHQDVQQFVETFLRIFGDSGRNERDGRVLHPTRHNGVYQLLVPEAIQDGTLPKRCRVAFDRKIATADWSRHDEPEFLAFGHPLLERMVHYCRVTKVSELGGHVTCMTVDYAGLPGVIFNYLLCFENRRGQVIRQELEPVFIDRKGHIQPEFGRRFYLADARVPAEPNQTTLAAIQAAIRDLQQAAEDHIRAQYHSYYQRVETQRNQEIAVLLEDLERFDRGIMEDFQHRLAEVGGTQKDLFEEAAVKGQRTRLENQIAQHQHRMEQRRNDVEQMRLGAFPAPELLNMVIVMPA